MIGNEEDFTACLGFEVEGVDENISTIEIDSFKNMIERAVKDFPNFKVTATTLRAVQTATINDWSAIAATENQVRTTFDSICEEEEAEAAAAEGGSLSEILSDDEDQMDEASDGERPSQTS